MAEVAISLAAKVNEAMLGGDTINSTRGQMNFLSNFKELTTYNIRMVLLEADAKWDQLPNQHQDLVRKLKDVVYDADDLFDEFLTVGGRLSRRMSREIKDIKKRFDAISINSVIFKDIVSTEAVRMRREETGSYVNVNDVVGRDKDKDAIIDMLLHPNGDNVVRFLSIVGVGGLGKTTLAQLVFNDERIKMEYPDPNYRIWVSVSDLYREQFDLKNLMSKILESVSNWKYDIDTSTMEAVQTQLLGKLKRKKYFLVLDDIWNEDLEKWLDLKRILMLGQGGSKVLVTTRSMRTSSIIGDIYRDAHAYMVQGLSKEDSWRLFEMLALTTSSKEKNHHAYMLQRLSKEDSWRLFEKLAFPTGSNEENHHDLVEIGKKVVERCSCIPLAIRVLGNILSDEPISKWQSFEINGFAEISKGDNEILTILKLSYNKLEPSIRSCFRYCASFPKDVTIGKEKIIGLWMAQGYVRPLDKDQSIEDASEEHFLKLLDRGFFQDVVRDDYGDVESFKIHDMMYYVAQEVGQEEICIMTPIVNSLGNNFRHVHHVRDECQDISLCNMKIRSYFSGSRPFSDIRIDNWVSLRVLDLSRCDVKLLPGSVGKLLHLRYLDLSHNKNLKLLCDPIARLYNLQTLDLNNCDKLTCLPSGMDKLSNLRVLPLFVVDNNISSGRQSRKGVLKDLEALCKIRGKICIRIGTNYSTEGEGADNSSGFLKRMEYLKEIRFEFKDGITCAYNPEAVLDKLEPPPTIKGIIMCNYKGSRIGWGREYHNWTASFPRLVHIVIWKCGNLQQMPLLSKLPFLKTLSLSCLDGLEYMENAISTSSSDEKVVEFFPSLESLKVMWMERLKGWWNIDDVTEKRGLRMIFPRLLYLKIYKCHNMMSFAPNQSSDNTIYHNFPCLRSLKIANCPNMACNLVCPTVETLELRDICERLQITSGNSPAYVKWREVQVDKLRYLKPVSTNSLTRLCIHGDVEVESLLEVEDAFQSCASSLRELEIRYCANLRELSGMGHLTALEKLKLLGNSKLSISENDEEPWKFFHQTLLHLKFDALPEMKSLPKGMQCLTSLQILELRWCKNLEELPQWMSCLSSLKSLSIIHCPRIRFLPEAMKELTSLKNLSIHHVSPVLFTRCKTPDGEDFPKIQHIANISIG